MPYQVSLGGTLNNGFPLQFPFSKIDSLSTCVTLVEQLSNDQLGKVIAHGTGFFWKHSKAVYLITARHVLSGKDPFNDTLMSDQGFIPEIIRVYPTVCIGNDIWTRAKVEVKLAINGSLTWQQDPEFATLRTDIAAVKIEGVGDLDVKCLNEYGDIFRHMYTCVGSDLSIAGYPFLNVEGAKTPIWRKAIVASEPYMPIDGKPMFLVDGTTSPGFSGAPVFRRQMGPVAIYDADGSNTTELHSVVTTSLVGVYAGRLQHKFYGGEVPFAFYANRIPMIIEAEAG